MTHTIYLNWDDFEQAVHAGVEEIKNSPFLMGEECVGVYGIPRGGLVLAVAISHRLRIPLLEKPIAGCAIVDDVIESGATMQAALNKLFEEGAAGTSVCHWAWISKTSKLRGGYYKYIDPENWIVFPWENFMAAKEERQAYYARRAPRQISTDKIY